LKTTTDGRRRSRLGAAGIKERVEFCTRCGAMPSKRERGHDASRFERVCPECGMGMLLGAARGALFAEHGAFMIVTADLRVSAVSEPAERLVGPEPEAIGANLLKLLADADRADDLALGVARAASGARGVVSVRVTALNEPRLGSLSARVSACGPPRAALVALAPAGAERR